MRGAWVRGNIKFTHCRSKYLNVKLCRHSTHQERGAGAEKAIIALVETGGDAPKVFEFVEAARNAIVLPEDNVVIPYAIGVDIACRMKASVYDRAASTIAGQRLANMLEIETCFSVGRTLNGARTKRSWARTEASRPSPGRCVTKPGRSSAATTISWSSVFSRPRMTHWASHLASTRLRTSKP